MKKILAILIMSSSLFLMCQRATPIKTDLVKHSLCGIDLGNDYTTYLNNIIDLQEKSPIKNKRKLVFMIKVHFLAPNQTPELSKIEVQTAIEAVNKAFSESNIQFHWDETIISYNQNVLLDEIYENMMLEETICVNERDKNVINLYVLQEATNVVGYTHYPIIGLQRIFIHRQKLQDASLIHEFGHYFGLLHTFESSISSAELVNDTNCSTNGDKICDTPADPLGASFVEDECKLFGVYRDTSGQIFTPDMGNYMSYYGNCRTHFSPLQIERMYFIAARIKYPQLYSGV